jgi:ferredoxin
MKTTRKILSIDKDLCDGCSLCVSSCAEGAIAIVDGKAALVAESFCDGLGACIGECPQGALHIVEAQVDPFEAPQPHELPMAPADSLPCGCPSTQIRTFAPAEQGGPESPRRDLTAAVSSLRTWPVKIRLVPPSAPFLNDAHLLVAADCTSVAYPRFHEDFLSGRVVLAGCPKFDEMDAYEAKFTEIFQRCRINGVTVLVMEVPCCQGFPRMIAKAAAAAGVAVPIETVTIGAEGRVLHAA